MYLLAGHFYRFLCCAAIALACFGSSFGQQRITGVVTESSSNTAMPGVSVKLESDLLPVAATTISDPQGRFAFTSLSPGEYNVSRVG